MWYNPTNMIMCIYGEDSFLCFEKLTQIQDRFITKFANDGGEIIEMDVKDGLAPVLANLGSQTLFLSQKLLVLRDFGTGLKSGDSLKLSAALERMPSTTMVVFLDRIHETKWKKQPLSRALKDPHIYHFPPLSWNDQGEWIKSRVERAGGTIDEDAISCMIEAASDSFQLFHFIHLLVYASDERHITRKLVEELAAGGASDRLFHFLDAIFDGHRQDALDLLKNERMAGVSEDHLKHMLLRHVRLLLHAGEFAGPSDQFAKEASVHPFAAKKALNQAKKTDQDALKHVHEFLFDEEILIRENISYPGLTNEKALIRLLSASPTLPRRKSIRSSEVR